MILQRTQKAAQLITCRALLHKQFSTSVVERDATPTDDKNVGIYVRTPERIRNPVHAFYIIRSLEKKFGKIAHVTFNRDAELPSRYLNRFHVLFEDEAAMSRIPKDGLSFRVPQPTIKNHAYGGPGIEDFRQCALAEEYDEEFETLPPGEMPKGEEESISLSVEPQLSPRFSLGRYPAFPQGIKRLMHSFMLWGGFQPLEPLPASTPILKKDFFSNDPPVDNIRMRAALQVCAHITGYHNPSILRRGAEKPAADPNPPVELEEPAAERNPIPIESIDTPPPSTSSPDTHTSLEADFLASTIAESPLDVPVASPPPPEPTAEELAEQQRAKEALERQLNVAKQLRGKQNKESSRANPAPPPKRRPRKESRREIREEAYEPPPSGILNRLMNLFGR